MTQDVGKKYTQYLETGSPIAAYVLLCRITSGYKDRIINKLQKMMSLCPFSEYEKSEI